MSNVAYLASPQALQATSAGGILLKSLSLACKLKFRLSMCVEFGGRGISAQHVHVNVVA